MYPILRMAKEFAVHRGAAPLGLFETHVSHHRCWPHDIDLWMELNNGRTLTLYDLGRLVLFHRTGLVPVMRKHGWAGTVAGSSVRYRRRIRMFDRIEMRSRLIGWDHRFVYVEQSMWRPQGDCANHILLRTAVTRVPPAAGKGSGKGAVTGAAAGAGGLVPTAEVARAVGEPVSPPLPGWVGAWIAADDERPWPPAM